MPLSAPVTPQPIGPGPVESGVQDEISGLAADARPGLAQAGLAIARILDDNPKAMTQQPAAAKVLPRCWQSCVRSQRVDIAGGWR